MKTRFVTAVVLLFAASAVALYVTGGAAAKPVQLAGAELRNIVPSIFTSGTLAYDG